MTPEGQVFVERKSVGSVVLRIVVGLALLVPAGLCCLGGLVAPTFYTAVMSVQEVSQLRFSEAQFVGLENYTRLFEARTFSDALGFTLLLFVVRVLVVAVVPLVLAFAVNEFGRAVRIPVRLLFTIPLALFAPVATALIWSLVLSSRSGLASGILQSLGQEPQRWLHDVETAQWAFLFVDGLHTFVLACGVGLVFYLAALRGSGEEAPSGRKALVPLIASWVTGMLATMALAVQSLVPSYLLTAGGPRGTTTTLELLLFNAFRTFRLGEGAAVATLLLIVLAFLGLVAGAIVALAGLRLETVPWGKQSGLISGEGKPGCGRVVAVLLLALVLLGSVGICSLSVLPLPWIALNSLRTASDVFSSPLPTLPFSPSLDAYTALGETVPIGSVVVNTLVPVLVSLLLLIPIAYAGALGIGAARPLGRWSELLLLPFSPWLFATIGPLSVVAYRVLLEARDLNTLFKLALPTVLYLVPMLFVLTLFFKGQGLKWRVARARGRSAAGAFLTTLILPSLPLVALLACVALFVGLQDLLWALLVGRGPGDWTMNMALLQMRAALRPDMQAAALTLFGLSTFVVSFLVFGLFQALYLDRLALGTDLFDVSR